MSFKAHGIILAARYAFIAKTRRGGERERRQRKANLPVSGYLMASAVAVQ
jgi:hypothetical protein